MKKEVVVISVQQACQILKEHGMAISPIHMRAGLECGAYKFGAAIKMAKSYAYEVYKPLLMQWIDERSEVVEDAAADRTSDCNSGNSADDSGTSSNADAA